MPEIENTEPIVFGSQEYEPLFRRLQGNIIKGHGREFTANIFLRFRVTGPELKATLRRLAETYVTSAYQQGNQRKSYLFALSHSLEGKRRDPLFGNLFLTRRTYEKLGLAEKLPEWFPDPAEGPRPLPEKANFLSGMFKAAGDLGDELTTANAVEDLELAYVNESIDALLVLANDSDTHLLETANALRAELESRQIADTVAFEFGRVRRNDGDQGIEQFGYADGISQPLFLKSEFDKLGSDAIDRWDPFAPLSLVLFRDPGVDDPDAFGSYYVFRKLEQNVRRFSEAEAALASALQLEGPNASRAGAMMIGRFRDGTPLAVSETSALSLSDANNFRYDGLRATLQPDTADRGDRLGLKCPFQAHIRKTNPRQSEDATTSTRDDIRKKEREHRLRRIVRRGITYGIRTPGDLPETGVGILFGCFQRSIMRQYAFMQRRWANTATFRIPSGGDGERTGLDPIIGQPASRSRPARWRREYGGRLELENEPEKLDDLSLKISHQTVIELDNFVTFRGGEFFFAPSLPFLRG
jgi:Dyp-type peroxidase family